MVIINLNLANWAQIATTLVKDLTDAAKLPETLGPILQMPHWEVKAFKELSKNNLIKDGLKNFVLYGVNYVPPNQKAVLLMKTSLKTAINGIFNLICSTYSGKYSTNL